MRALIEGFGVDTPRGRVTASLSRMWQNADDADLPSWERGETATMAIDLVGPAGEEVGSYVIPPFPGGPARRRVPLGGHDRPTVAPARVSTAMERHLEEEYRRLGADRDVPSDPGDHPPAESADEGEAGASAAYWVTGVRPRDEGPRAIPWALRVEDVDLAAGVIHVERGWDDSEGAIELKSHAGRRNVPIPAILRDYPVEHRMAHPDPVLMFGNGEGRPFTPSNLQRRADKAWAEAANLNRITPHGCRHTYASLMIAAGVNAKALSTFMGHSTITITLDRYGHLMPGSEEEAAGLLDNYLSAQREEAEHAARTAVPAAG